MIDRSLLPKYILVVDGRMYDTHDLMIPYDTGHGCTEFEVELGTENRDCLNSCVGA